MTSYHNAGKEEEEEERHRSCNLACVYLDFLKVLPAKRILPASSGGS